MPKFNQLVSTELTPEQFLDSCSFEELLEIDLNISNKIAERELQNSDVDQSQRTTKHSYWNRPTGRLTNSNRFEKVIILNGTAYGATDEIAAALQNIIENLKPVA